MARGCETVTDSRRLQELDFVKDDCKCVPGLLFPILDFRGSTIEYQYRPDFPRLRKDGKPGEGASATSATTSSTHDPSPDG